MRRLGGKPLVFAAALALVSTAAVAASQLDRPVPVPPMLLEVPEDGADSTVDLAQHLIFPVVSVEQADWMTEVQDVVGHDENFTSVAISLDRTSMTVTWHGEPSAQLKDLLAAAPSDVRVDVAASAYPGGRLRDLIHRAFEQGQFDGFRVVSGGMNNDGSGITLDVVSKGATQDHVRDDIAAAIGSGDIPVTINLVAGDAVAF